MTENAKTNAVLRALFALPISAGHRLGAFFLWGMLLPENLKSWRNFLQRQRRVNNPEKTRANSQKSYWTAPEKRASASRDWRRNNPGAQRAADIEWREANPGWCAEYMQKCMEDPAFRALHYMRTRLRAALKGGAEKVAATKELLGMGLKEFRIYIQGQFLSGMTWENYGPVWHVDHVRPCASFDFLDSEQQRECFHWSNLQPMFAKENLQKGTKHV